MFRGGPATQKNVPTQGQQATTQQLVLPKANAWQKVKDSTVFKKRTTTNPEHLLSLIAKQ